MTHQTKEWMYDITYRCQDLQLFDFLILWIFKKSTIKTISDSIPGRNVGL
jgi:hypothetical protein